MTEDSKSEKPAIDFEEAMRRAHDRYDGVFKALAKLERRERELAEKENGTSKPQTSSSDEQ
jgi:hypothetical protein